MCEHEDPKPFGHKAFMQDERLRQLKELNVEPRATGRTVVVEVMTEAQAREAFEAWEDTKPRLFGSDIWMAALRHAGVLK